MNSKERRMSKEERRKQILESALKVFIKKGYNGATTQEIAKAAGVSEVTLFRYFSSKQEIFMEGIEPILFTTLKESIVASRELTVVEQLEYILIERIKLISKNHEVIRLILMESQISDELKNLNYIEKILGLLEDTIAEIGLPMDDKRFTLRLLAGSILSFLYMPEKREEHIKDFVDKFISNIFSS